jgi:hypothetical protein
VSAEFSVRNAGWVTDAPELQHVRRIVFVL